MAIRGFGWSETGTLGEEMLKRRWRDTSNMTKDADVDGGDGDIVDTEGSGAEEMLERGRNETKRALLFLPIIM